MPIRKLSLSRKSSSNDVRSLEGQMRKDKPPPVNARTAAAIAEINNGSVNGGHDSLANGTPSPHARKNSIAAKSKRRLSAIFHSSPKTDKHLSPSAHASATASPAGSIRSAPRSDVDRYAGLPSHGQPPVADATAGATAGVGAMSLVHNGASPAATPVLASTPARGSSATTPASALVTSADRSSSLQVPGQDASPTGSGMSTPTRAAAAEKLQTLYTKWGDVSDSDSDDDAYLTPDEGLSDVAEGDEDDIVPNGKPTAQPKAAAALTPEASFGKGANGTGPKLRRSAAAGAKVNSRHAFKRGDPTTVDQAECLARDIDTCRTTLTLFLCSKMKESEQLLVEKDPENTHMYLQSAHGIIQSLKGMMTFDSEDLGAALDITKATAFTASAIRRPNDGVLSKIGGLVRSGQGVARVRQMSPLERHAELVYAETILIKAMLSIVSGGDWLGLIKEALNMRSAHGIYRTLQQYLDEADKDGFDDDIDMDFRSGVLLGTGTSSLMLSLLPGAVLKVAEVFGYAGDREVAIATLMSAGGWSKDSKEPAYNEANEGIRRPVCDMILLTFHLVISVLIPVAGVDIPAARKILTYNMRRYPDGIFFLYFQARLFTSECEPEKANASLQRALDLDLEYVQLQHMCLWDYGCNYLQLTNWEGARQCFDILRQESNWSRAVYTYATAVNVMELADDPNAPESTEAYAAELVSSIPKLTKKIAGKSLPIEKLVSRKARKFLSQGQRLFLPAMELTYVFGSLGLTPRRILLSKWLPHINAELGKLEASTPETWGDGTAYWDDYVLGHFLRGMVQFISRWQPIDASQTARQPVAGEPSDEELDAGAESDFKLVIEHAPEVRLDHYLLFHNHYELGRLYARRGDKVNAKANFDIVMSNKLPLANKHAGKKHGKYSLEGALQLKTHAAMQALNGR